MDAFRVRIGLDPGRKALLTAVTRVEGRPDKVASMSTKTFRQLATGNGGPAAGA